MGVADLYRETLKDISTCETLRLSISNTDDKKQRDIIYESILLRTFRIFENFVEKLFLQYMIGEKPLNEKKVECCVLPKDLSHAREIISGASTSPFLDWSDSVEVRRRSMIVFEKDNPIYTALVGKADTLRWMKALRNQIAHNSEESRRKYISVIQTILSYAPNPTPTVGEFLALLPAKGQIKNREILAFFITEITECCECASGKP